jgi:hypothetical protein
LSAFLTPARLRLDLGFGDLPEFVGLTRIVGEAGPGGGGVVCGSCGTSGLAVWAGGGGGGGAVGRGKDRGAMRQTSNLHGVSMVAVSICGGAPKLGRRWCRQGSSA